MVNIGRKLLQGSAPESPSQSSKAATISTLTAPQCWDIAFKVLLAPTLSQPSARSNATGFEGYSRLSQLDALSSQQGLQVTAQHRMHCPCKDQLAKSAFACLECCLMWQRPQLPLSWHSSIATGFGIKVGRSVQVAWVALQTTLASSTAYFQHAGNTLAAQNATETVLQVSLGSACHGAAGPCILSYYSAQALCLCFHDR